MSFNHFSASKNCMFIFLFCFALYEKRQFLFYFRRCTSCVRLLLMKSGKRYTFFKCFVFIVILFDISNSWILSYVAFIYSTLIFLSRSFHRAGWFYFYGSVNCKFLLISISQSDRIVILFCRQWASAFKDLLMILPNFQVNIGSL